VQTLCLAFLLRYLVLYGQLFNVMLSVTKINVGLHRRIGLAVGLITSDHSNFNLYDIGSLCDIYKFTVKNLVDSPKHLVKELFWREFERSYIV